MKDERPSPHPCPSPLPKRPGEEKGTLVIAPRPESGEGLPPNAPIGGQGEVSPLPESGEGPGAYAVT